MILGRAQKLEDFQFLGVKILTLNSTYHGEISKVGGKKNFNMMMLYDAHRIDSKGI